MAEGMDGKHPSVSYPFMVQTPKRVFNFSAESGDEMCEWMLAFEQAMKPVEWQLPPGTLSKDDRQSILSIVSNISGCSSSSGESEHSNST